MNDASRPATPLYGRCRAGASAIGIALAVLVAVYALLAAKRRRS